MLLRGGILPAVGKQRIYETLLKFGSSRRGIHDVAARPSNATFPARQFLPHVSNHMGSTRNGTVRTRRRFLADTVRFASSQHGLPHRAFIALGSNMGDRVAMIEQACREVDASNHVKIMRTSSLYETKAMYVLDQDNFVNGACEVDEQTALQ